MHPQDQRSLPLVLSSAHGRCFRLTLRCLLLSAQVEAMKKRSKVANRPAKARSRKALKPKGRSATKALSHRGAAPARETEVERLTRELNDALKRESATSGVLKVISRSTFDLQMVLDNLIETAATLCEAYRGAIFRSDGDRYHGVAFHNASSELIEFVQSHPITPGRHTITARVALERRMVHVADLQADPEYKYALRDVEAIRTELGVPMFRGDDILGVFILYKLEVQPFTDKQIELVTTFADQAAIAIENARLLSELRQRTSDLTESLEQQTATANVLRVISSSSADIQPVLDTIVRTAAELCASEYAALFRLQDGNYHAAAWNNAAAEWVKYYSDHTISVDRGSLVGRTALERSAIHIVDCLADPEYAMHEAARLGRQRSMLGVPLLNNGIAIGVIGLLRTVVQPFTDKQIELVTAFADQAVIAIENARLLNELRKRTADLTQRTADLTESLEQQTATSEVLQVISSSPGDLQPVFSGMLEKAVRICDANFGNIYRWDGKSLHLFASHNTPPAFAEARSRSPHQLPELSADALASVPGRMARTKSTIHVPDLAADQAYIERYPQTVAAVELGGVRTFLSVPMLKEGELIGAFALSRQEVRPFTEKQIGLVTNFAAQAVIAIENARLLNELRESLQEQTATAEVLQVISGSPADLQPVFATMLEKAVRICKANFGNIFRWHDDALHLVAPYNIPPAFAEFRKRAPFRPDAENPIGRMVETKTVVHVADLAAESRYKERLDQGMVAAVELGGVRTFVAVPMLRESELIGALIIYRQEVRPFTDKQIALVTNFAAQAVIAIENARLLTELRESLEEQTATSDVLKVISSSPGDLQPVFAAMLEKAVRICDATFGNIYRWDGDALQLVATHNTPPAYAEHRKHSPFRAEQNNSVAQMITSKKVVHLLDAAANETTYATRRDPTVVAAVELGGIRSALIVPMLKEDELVGAFIVSRQEVRPFTEKQIALVTNFAAQAVIAIENVRLLMELRERTEEVEKLNQHLESRVADQVDEIERTGRLRRFLPPQVADLIVASGTEKQLESHRREITALFCDLRGFTGFSESADPEDVMALLREYHAAIGEIIVRYSGTLERYAGDGVMVVFNDPIPVDNPALQAVLMALEMRDAIGALTEKWRRLGHDIGFGIGIAHGFATLGTIGFEGRFDYAAIGTVSNVASRLCDEAKPGQILISPRVLMAVEDAVTVEPVGEFELKGIRRPIAAYNVVAALPPSP